MGFYDAPDGQMIANCYVGRVSNVASDNVAAIQLEHTRGLAAANGSCLEARRVKDARPGSYICQCLNYQSFPQGITAAKTASAV
ncbi:hypothetical protein PAXRUDRAFT_828274, partial [Paxillus rubicundulus Ve08.2h10]